ncbi:MAG: hypothetical protein R6V32_04890 [Bacteroidales bacterium]
MVLLLGTSPVSTHMPALTGVGLRLQAAPPDSGCLFAFLRVSDVTAVMQAAITLSGGTGFTASPLCINSNI